METLEDRCLLAFSVVVHLSFRRDFFVTLELTSLARLTGRRASENFLSASYQRGDYACAPLLPAFHLGVVDLTLDSPASAANIVTN